MGAAVGARAELAGRRAHDDDRTPEARLEREVVSGLGNARGAAGEEPDGTAEDVLLLEAEILGRGVARGRDIPLRLLAGRELPHAAQRFDSRLEALDGFLHGRPPATPGRF